MKIVSICTACKKMDCGDGTWSELHEEAPEDAVTALCPDCCHERFPQLYSDYEKPEGRLIKKFTGLFSSKSKR